MPLKPETKQILIIGASARAAAHSAARAGIDPHCIDLFADRDTQSVARTRQSLRYPADLPELASTFPHCPWMYVGALENHPRILETIAAARPLLGNPADVVREIRNPLHLFDLLSRGNFVPPEVRSRRRPPPAEGNWLLKPLRSAAGRGIALWTPAAQESCTLREPHYFQQYAPGESHSAVFLADQHQSLLLGVTRQLTGTDWLHGAAFAYCGSIGPLRLPPETERQLQRLGTFLTKSFLVRGLFGIDFQLDGSTPRPLEVNPRYTASVEVLELACETSFLPLHVAACTGAGEWPVAPNPRTIAGKAILYADRSLVAPDLQASRAGQGTGEFPSLADIPAPGTLIRRGHPVCTLLVRAESEPSCLSRLKQHAAAIEHELHATISPADR